MGKAKNACKSLLKKFDYFGVPYTFYHKSEEKYHSATGGFTFLLFIAVTITYISISLVSFVRRKNFSIIYYNMRITPTDEISFSNFSTNLAFGIDCGSAATQEELTEMFTMEFNHVSMKTEGGVYSKEKKNFKLEHCTYSDFYNEFNQTFNDIGLDKLYCPQAYTNHSIQGIYSDTLFKYFEFRVMIKNKTKENFEKIKQVLTNEECDLNFYFIDVAVNLYNYKNPIERFINTNFIVLKYDEYTKVNVDFLQQKFDSYENYLFDTYDPKSYIGFDSIQQYSTFKGERRFEEQPEDFDQLSKMYIRAALNRNMIQRKYMKLTEFAANMSSILSGILVFLFVTVSCINRFYASNSVMKKIFHFQDTETFKEKSIKEKYLPKTTIQTGLSSDNPVTSGTITGLNQVRDEISATQVKIQSSSLAWSINKRKEFKKSTEELKMPLGYRKYNPIFSSQLYRRKGTENLTKTRREKSKSKLKYDFFELISAVFFPCFSSKKLDQKNELREKAKEIFCFQLDILTYLKKMQHYEILTYVILNKDEKNIINFLSKPSISLERKNKILGETKDDYIAKMSSKKVNEFYKSLKNVNEKSNKSQLEKKLCYLAEVELKSFNGIG